LRKAQTLHGKLAALHNEDMIAKRGMALCFLKGCSTESDIMIQDAVIPDDRCFSDHNTHAVVDEAPAPNCGGGYKLVPDMPPMPGMAQLLHEPTLSGEAVWRLPEYPVAQASREETIAAVVTDLPSCCQQTPKDTIRNQGLYGIKGNLSCDLLKRSAVSDRGFLEPLAARNAFLAYNSYDQLHAKDPYLIPVNKKQPE
jgi:hypothetical protein